MHERKNPYRYLPFVFCALLAMCCNVQQASGQVMDIDSIPRAAAYSAASRISGTVTLGAGDSVTVNIDGVTSTDKVLLAYSSTAAEAATTTVLSWGVWADVPNTLTIYGTATKTATYIIIR